jgi:hypothetical protein
VVVVVVVVSYTNVVVSSHNTEELLSKDCTEEVEVVDMVVGLKWSEMWTSGTLTSETEDMVVPMEDTWY